jgi:thiamine biosynthesis lipoprotein
VTARRFLFLALAAVLPAASCRPGATVLRKQTRLLMDTYVTIQALGRAPVADRAIEATFARLEDINRKFNHLDSTSQLYAFNTHNEPLTDPELVEVVKAAVAVSEASGGAFDITVRPLVELWGFYGDHPAVPSQRAIDSCLRMVGYRNLIVESGLPVRGRTQTGRVTKRRPDVTIDLGGIAKGYALKEAARVLRAGGVDSALIDLGGDVYAMGRKGNRNWKVGVRNPRREGVVGVAAVSNLAVVTSGDYECCFFGPDSVRYCHIIDPATGWPPRGLISTTVVMRDPLTAQGWSKVLFIRGKDALPLVERTGGIEALLVTDKQEVIRSAGWPE